MELSPQRTMGDAVSTSSVTEIRYRNGKFPERPPMLQHHSLGTVFCPPSRHFQCMKVGCYKFMRIWEGILSNRYSFICIS